MSAFDHFDRTGEGIFPWKDVEACRRRAKRFWWPWRKSRRPEVGIARHGDRAHACPRCGTPGRELTWVDFTTPPPTWEHLCGRAGWITLCDSCRRQVDFFCEVLN